jgi:hypothetical protein
VVTAARLKGKTGFAIVSEQITLMMLENFYLPTNPWRVDWIKMLPPELIQIFDSKA